VVKHFEIDSVIGPAETRPHIVSMLGSCRPRWTRPGGRAHCGRFVGT
jgi:hypothetical protein